MLKAFFQKLKKSNTQTEILGNRQKGNYGEELALKYLKKKGYKLLAKNYRVLRCEIDIIMLYKDIVVFIEVKARKKGEKYGLPKEAVTKQKQNNIKKAASVFMLDKRFKDCYGRFDVVEVYLDDNTVNHIENAFF